MLFEMSADVRSKVIRTAFKAPLYTQKTDKIQKKKLPIWPIDVSSKCSLLSPAFLGRALSQRITCKNFPSRSE